MINILKKKQSYSREIGAWEQYRHLADWLVEIASRMLIRGSPIEVKYLDLAKYSFENCSRRNLLGYSWHAYKEWNTRWKSMKPVNRTMLEDLVEKGNWREDLEIKRIHQQ